MRQRRRRPGPDGDIIEDVDLGPGPVGRGPRHVPSISAVPVADGIPPSAKNLERVSLVKLGRVHWFNGRPRE